VPDFAVPASLASQSVAKSSCISSPNVRCGSPRATGDDSVVSWLEHMPMQHDVATQNVRRSTQGSERAGPRSLVEQRNGSIVV
jgi:hypothetical protein